MKYCSTCRRTYSDETLNFCLEDGEWLVSEDGVAGPTSDILENFPSEAPTRLQRADEGSREGTASRGSDPSENSFRRLRRNPSFLIAAVLGIALLSGYSAYRYLVDTTGNQIKSIAVLPFQNKSTEPDTEYLSEGVAESLIYRLSQLPDLRVSPTSSVFRYKGDEIDAVKIGRELGVDAVLYGRIIQRGESLTISADLVDVSNNRQLWGEQYARKTADLLATQREIAREIVDTLRIKVSSDAGSFTKNYTESNEAYHLYLKGRFHWNKRNQDSILKSVDYFNQAIEKDPNFALAYAGLADAYVVPALRRTPNEVMPKAKAAAMHALEIDDTLAEAHTSLARVLQVYDWNWKDAEKEFKRALELNPRYPVAHQWYGGYLERAGKIDEAISERKVALELDPLSTITNFELGQAYYFARRYDQAIQQFEKTLELDPNFPAAQQYLPLVYVQKGMYEEATARTNAVHDEFATPGYVHAVAGRTAEARKVLDDLKSLRAKSQYISAVGIALVHLALGEKDEALQWLEKGYDERAFQMQFLKLDPRWDSLRSDPRFVDLVRRIGFPE